MVPLHPEMREALKKAHPGLTDAEIDRVETLLVHRVSLDAERQANEIGRVNAELAGLIRQRMPHYQEVARAFAETRRTPERRPAVRIERKPRSQD